MRRGFHRGVVHALYWTQRLLWPLDRLGALWRLPWFFRWLYLSAMLRWWDDMEQPA